MIRRLLSVIAFALTGLLMLVGIASADDYVPSAVTSGAAGGAISSTTTPAEGVAGALSYTGAGFNVGGAVAIAAIVVLVGIALVVAGTRMTRRRSAGH